MPTYREAFRNALISEWAQGKLGRAAALRTADQVAIDQEHASRLFGAAVIDNTHRMLAALSHITAQRLEVRA